MATVKRSEVAEKDLYGDVRKSAIETREEIKALNIVLNDSARALGKELNEAIVKDTKSLQAFTKAITEANRLKKEAINLDKREAVAIDQKYKAEINSQKLKQQSLKTEREEIRNAQILERQKVAQAKAQERAAKSALDENNAYKKLVVATRDQKNESKRLAVEMIKLADSGRRNSKEYRAVADSYRKVTKEAQAGDKALKKIDATVGDNFRNVGNYAKGLEGLKTSFIRIAGALGAFRALRGIGKIVVEFDQAQADLLAISGQTEKQMAGLTQQAKDLGATTQFSATQITQMQIELAKLGFTTDQISKSTKAVSSFAAATGAEIPDAAALAGASLRAFELDASEMERVVSVLGVATTKTGLDFGFLETAMSTIAPVANAFGFSIEDSTALLGQLANSGFDASSAATATRNILLNLADANGKLAKELGRPITSADDLAGALTELDARGIDLASSLELTDKRSVAAFQTFLKGSKDLVPLRDSITDVNDELQDMADKRLDSISGQFTLLTSAWEGWILAANEGSGAGAIIKDLFSWLASNLGFVISLVAKLTAGFLLYKAALKSLQLLDRIRDYKQFQQTLKATTKDVNDSTGALKNSGKAAKTASPAIKGFGQALKAIGFTVIVGALIEIALAFYDIASGAAAARRQAGLYRLAEERADKSLTKTKSALTKYQQEEINKINIARSLNQITAEEQIAQIKKVLKFQRDLLAVRIKQLRASNEQIEINKKLNEKQKQKNEDNRQSVQSGGDPAALARAQEELNEKNRQLNASQEKNRIIIRGLKEEYNLLNQSVTDYIIDENNLTTATNDSIEAGKKKTKATKEINTEFKNQIDLLKELNDQYDRYIAASRSIEASDRTEEIAGTNDLIEAEKRLQLQRAALDGTGDASGVESLINDRKQLEIQAIEEVRDFEIQELKNANNERFNELESSLKAERKELIKGAKGNAEALTEIEANYQIELAKLKALELDAETVIDQEIIAVKTNANNEILQLERETANEIKEVKKEISDANGEFAEKELQKKKDELKAIEDAEKESAKRRQDLAKLVSDYLIKKADERIAKLDEEIQAHENQFDALKALAEAGNINAQQSLAEEQRLINEANKAKIEEEKRKQRIELASSAYATYQSNVEGGSEQPLADTIRDIALLQAFINSIPAFESGTENTGANGKGIDGKGGFLSVLHPYERVVPKEENAKLGSVSNVDLPELVRIGQNYLTGKIGAIHEGADQIGGAWQNLEVINKLNGIEKAIINKPENEYAIEKVTTELFGLMHKQKKGNSLIFNKYRLKS